MSARADDSAYCRKTQARAASDASPLFAPTVGVQGIRFPRSGQVDIGSTVGNGYQARGFVSLSVTDLLKGIRVLDVGRADCAQHEALVVLNEFLTSAKEHAELLSFRALSKFLVERRDQWRTLADRATARLERNVITLVEFNEIQKRVDVLEHKAVMAEGEVTKIEAHEPRVPEPSLNSLELQYRDKALKYEGEISRLRKLQPWGFKLTGGVTAATQADWYGLAEISFNLGGISRYGQEASYLSARADEIRRARYEPSESVRRFRAEVAAIVERAEKDLQVLERTAKLLGNARSLLEQSETGSASHARDVLTIEQLEIAADAVYLHTLIRSLRAVTKEGSHEHKQPGRSLSSR